MKIKQPGFAAKCETLDDFKRVIAQTPFDFPCASDLSALKKPFRIYDKTVPNAICCHPLEGEDAAANGGPSKLTMHKYNNFAKQGAGMIWFEAVCVSEDGKDGPHQMIITKDNVADFKYMVQQVDATAEKYHHEKPYKILQLTHSGRRAMNPVTAFESKALDAHEKPAEVVTDERVRSLSDELVTASQLAMQAGFDAIDFKLCHDYLIKELLTARTRKGPFGGDEASRFTFTVETIDKIKQACGDGIDIAVRLNAYDAIPYPDGWGMANDSVMRMDLSEPIDLVKILYNMGVRLFSISANEPRFAPTGDGCLAAVKGEEIDPLDGVSTLFKATQVLRNTVRALGDDAKFISAGLAWFGPFAPYVAAGCIEDGVYDIVGFGRGVLSDPNYIANILYNDTVDRDKLCLCCDGCFGLQGQGLPAGCVMRSPFYREIAKTAAALK